MSLGDENARAHRHPAVDSTRTVGIDFAAVLDRLQSGFGSAAQRPDGDRNQRRVKGRQPEKLYGTWMKILAWTIFHAHVDDKLHAEFAQVVVIHRGRCSADEEIIGDGGEVHARNVITDASLIAVDLARSDGWHVPCYSMCIMIFKGDINV